MKVPKPPCKVNNQDCPDRHLHCHSTCKEYIQYEQDKKVYDAFVQKQKQEDIEYQRYLMQQKRLVYRQKHPNKK